MVSFFLWFNRHKADVETQIWNVRFFPFFFNCNRFDQIELNNILESAQVESLSSGKSMESIKSTTISDSEGPTSDFEEEKWYSITLQVFIPFMIAGMGTIGAGIVLGNVEVLNNAQIQYELN